MFKRLFVMVKKEFIQLFRDKRMLTIIILAPIIQLFIFGYVATTDVKHISVAVYDLDNSVESRKFIDLFKNSGYFDINYYAGSSREIKELMDSSKIKVAIVIDKGFAKKIKLGEPATCQVIVDGSDSNTATIANGYISSIVWRFESNILKERLNYMGAEDLLRPPFENEVRVWYNPELKSVNFMVPGMIATLILMNIMSIAAMSIVKETEYGTIEQIMVTPIKPYELLIGKTIPPILIAYIDVFLTLLVGTLWFKVPFVGNIFLLLILCILFLITSLGLGIFISLISKTQHQAMMTAFLFLFPSVLLSGFIFPIENMPKVIQMVTLIIPLRYFLVILRGIYSKGIGIKYLWNQVIPLIILGGALFVVSVLNFRKKLS